MSTLSILMSAFVLSIVGLGFFIWSQRARLTDSGPEASEIIFAKGEIGHPEKAIDRTTPQAVSPGPDEAELLARVRADDGGAAGDRAVPLLQHEHRGTLAELALALLLLTATLAGFVAAWSRWSRRAAWIAGAPAVVAALWLTSSIGARLLPALL